MSLILNILTENFLAVDEELDAMMHSIMAKKFVEIRKMIVAEEKRELNEGRFRVVKVRVRKGKIERRKKVSNLANFTFRKKGSGPAKLVRMSALERRHRKLGAKRGKIKRRGKMSRIRQKTKRSMMKRRSLGL